MLNLQKGFDIAKRNVLSKFIHPHHKRTIELARQYKALITGEDLEFMLRKFDRRESQEDFEQANRIAQQITPAITAAMMNPARRLGGVKPVVDRIDYGRENNAKADKLRDGINTFSAIGLDQYLSSLVDPSDADPNGFVILTFEDFDERYEKPQVFPIIVGCENVYDAPRVSNELQYLYLGFDIKYVIDAAKYNADGSMQTEATTANGKRYAMFIDNHHIVFEQVKKDAADAPVFAILYDEGGAPVEITKDKGVNFTKGASKFVYYFRTDKETLFQVTFYEQKSGRVPCFPLGCKPDTHTGGATFVNRWHDAMPYLKKSLKQVRELDLTTALHAIPQKLQYISKCRATGCNGGILAGDLLCDKCKGSGFMTISSAQDHITLPLPKDPQDAFDLSKIVHYVQLPVDLIQQMREIVKDTRSDAFKAVYGYDLNDDGQVGKTYEQVIAMNQAMYDALSPLALWRERTRTMNVYVFASYNDMAEGLKVVYKYPRDFGFETSAQILALMEKAAMAGAPTSYRANLSMKLSVATFSDDEVMLAREKTQASMDPFPGMSDATITSAIAGGQVSKRSATRWLERATIFAKCEQQNSSFYDLVEAKQREIYDKVVDEMLGEMPETELPAMATTGVDEDQMDTLDTNVDPNAGKVQDTALNGAQVSSLVEVVSLVATGVLTIDTASAMLRAAFPGIDEGLVAQMLSNVKVVTPEQIQQAGRVADPNDPAGTPSTETPTDRAKAA